MSAYSTIYLSRDRVIGYIHGRLHELDNDDLEKIMDILLEPRLYNTKVKTDGMDDYVLDY